MTFSATLPSAALALAALAIDATIGAQAVALPITCAGVTDPAHRIAITSAEAWIEARWRPAGPLWTTTFTLKPAPALPLGIGTFGRAQRDGGEPATLLGGPAAPIAGAAQVNRIACTTYEANSDAAGPTYVVRFTGRRLRFDEAASGWSRPLPNAVLHVLMVQAPAASGTTFSVHDLPESRTALPPDMHLTLPPPSPIPVPPARAPAAKRR